MNDTRWKLTDTETYVQRLAVTDPLIEPTLRFAIQAPQPPSGSWRLDAGCCIGLHAALLAEAVRPAGHITGLDLAPEFLGCASETVERVGLLERISFG